MRLLCDEDTGTGVPRALRHVGYDAISQYDMTWGGHKDKDWLPRAGELGLLVFSSNKKMLAVPLERQLIIDHKVGIVFLTTGIEHTPAVLRLLLAKWEKLELLHATEPRPFARFLSPSGRFADRYRGLQL